MLFRSALPYIKKYLEPLYSQGMLKTKMAVQSIAGPLGNITLRIVERQPDHSIKFGADNSPIAFNLWVDMDSIDENNAELKVKLEADIPFMIKAMIGSKVDGFVKQFAEMIAMVLNSSTQA